MNNNNNNNNSNNEGSSTLFNFETNSLLNNFSYFYSCNIIIGIDFTASNEWKGRKTFNQQSLHKTLGNKLYNPYQKVIAILVGTINKLINSSTNSETNESVGLKIYPYGFGDSVTRDRSVFSLVDPIGQCQNDCINDSSFENEYFETFDAVLNR